MKLFNYLCTLFLITIFSCSKDKEKAPYYFTFGANNKNSGLNLEPADKQTVVMTYGVPDPAGSTDRVGKVRRPANGKAGGFEDFKFKQWQNKIDFSVYHKFKIEVYLPSSNDFSGPLKPQIELLFHDNDSIFWERWTVISHTVAPSDFDKWTTIEYDGTDVTGLNGKKLPAQTTYDNITIRFGGSNHKEAGTFYIKSFIPIK